MAKKISPSVLVTGAAGFIGANLVRRLCKEGYDVHILQKSSSNLWRLSDIISEIKVYNQSLSDRNGLTQLLKIINPEIIYHLAAHGSYSSQANIDEIVSVNIQGTLNLLLASKDIKYTCFVNTGSSSEYGMKENSMKEDDYCEPISFYGASKLSATILSQVFAREYQKPIVTFRLFSVYGPYEEKTRFVPTIIYSVLGQKGIQTTSSEVRRDFIYIEDVLSAYIKVAENTQSVSGHILNIGTGIEHTNDEVVETLFRVTGKRVPIEKGGFPKRMWDIPHWKADIAKAEKMLSWKPFYALEKGLLESYNWLKDNRKLYEK